MAINTATGWGTVINNLDAWRINSAFSGNATPISSNWERVDSDGYSKIGDGMSQSSGVFTFPKTGIWQITARGSWYLTSGADSRYLGIEMEQTQDNSDYGNCARFYTNINGISSTTYQSGTCTHFFDVENTSNYKVRFRVEAHNSSASFDTSSSHSQNLFYFIRLGDT